MDRTRTLGLTIVSLGLVSLAGCSGGTPANANRTAVVAVSQPSHTNEPTTPTTPTDTASLTTTSSSNNSTANTAQPPAPTQTQPQSPTTGFSYPADKGGQQLNKLLTPSLPRLVARAEDRKQQPMRPTPLERTELLVPTPTDEPLRLPLPPLAKLMPRPLNDAVLEIASEPVPTMPPVPRLAFAPPVRIDGPDLSKPAAMPSLARYQQDRASLGDPTGDYSTEAVLTRELPERVGPAPFDKLDLPKPNSAPIGTRLPAAERDDPLLHLPRLPAR